MTEQEIEKIADLIVNKLITKQAEYDARFIAELTDKVGPEYDICVESIKPLSIDEQVQQLYDQIDSCIKTENFEAIVALQEQIKKLLNGEN